MERLTCFIPYLSVDHNAARKLIHPHILPESLMSLRALLSEKEDISEAGLSAACSKLLKGTLQVYTTNSDSSGLSLDTPGCNHTNQCHFKPAQNVKFLHLLHFLEGDNWSPSCPVSSQRVCLQNNLPLHLTNCSLMSTSLPNSLFDLSPRFYI